MTVHAPKQILEHPLESLLAAGLLLSLLLVAADGTVQISQQNQTATNCQTATCVATMEPHK
jgi:hypothetical protein